LVFHGDAPGARRTSPYASAWWKLKFEVNAADLENGLLLCASYKGGMSAIPSIAAVSVAASSHRLDAFQHHVANGLASGALPTPAASNAGAASTVAAASTAAPASHQAGVANVQGPAPANQVDATGALAGTAAASQPAPSVVVDYDPRSPYGPTNGVPPSADLASEMIQQLVAYYPFTANGQVHPDTQQTVDFKT
jgi:hypothetical protein